MYFGGLHEEIHEFWWSGNGQVSHQNVMNLSPRVKEIAPHQQSSETGMLDIVAVVIDGQCCYLQVHLQRRGCRVD
jgi:hypothetical protein